MVLVVVVMVTAMKTIIQGLSYSQGLRAHRNNIDRRDGDGVGGIPCVMVAVLMGSVIDGYGGECACWLNVQYGTMWIWLAEVCLVVAVNTVLLSLIMRTFISLKANTKKSETDRLKATARALLIMMPMLGMTWMFALLQASFKNVFLQWLFILLNALQGPVFFVFQCVMHPEVRKVIGRKRKTGDSSKWAMKTSTSGIGRTETTDKGISHATESKLGEVQKVIGRKRKTVDSSKWAMKTSTTGIGRTELTGISHATESKLGEVH
eukprot:XP_011665495.1 PREDICTED: probable G-protein coupled receptor 133 [Strongylocentrotus purpuratus]